jgi:hypothetical protein
MYMCELYYSCMLSFLCMICTWIMYAAIVCMKNLDISELLCNPMSFGFAPFENHPPNFALHGSSIHILELANIWKRTCASTRTREQTCTCAYTSTHTHTHTLGWCASCGSANARTHARTQTHARTRTHLGFVPVVDQRQQSGIHGRSVRVAELLGQQDGRLNLAGVHGTRHFREGCLELSVCVCMYVCLYVCMHAWSVCVYVCMCMYVWSVCMYVNMHACSMPCISVCSCIFEYIDVCFHHVKSHADRILSALKKWGKHFHEAYTMSSGDKVDRSVCLSVTGSLSKLSVSLSLSLWVKFQFQFQFQFHTLTARRIVWYLLL